MPPKEIQQTKHILTRPKPPIQSLATKHKRKQLLNYLSTTKQGSYAAPPYLESPPPLVICAPHSPIRNFTGENKPIYRSSSSSRNSEPPDAQPLRRALPLPKPEIQVPSPPSAASGLVAENMTPQSSSLGVVCLWNLW